MMAGWCLWILAASVNVVLVEKFLKKLFTTKAAYGQLYQKPKSAWLIIEKSIFSLENCVLMIVTVVVMSR